MVAVWGNERRGGSFESALIKKDVLLSLFIFNIYINRSFSHPRHFISLFFSFSGPFFPVVNISLFVCFWDVSCAYHTSHSESLDVTERMDVPVSTRSVILDTLVVGLAAVEGDSAEL